MKPGLIVAINVLVIINAVLAAIYQADRNARSITRQRTEGMHTHWGFVRLILFVGIGFALHFFGGYAVWRAACICCGAGAMFYSFVLRRSLNAHMGWDAHYMGSTAWYDMQWVRHYVHVEPAFIRLNHTKLWRADGKYRERVKNAERAASAFELITAAALVVLASL